MPDGRASQIPGEPGHEYIGRENSSVPGIVVKKDTWFIKDSEIKINNTRIPAIDPDVALRYLGAKIWPWNGVYCGIVVPKILSMVRRVKSVKPCQKVKLLTKYIFSRFMYNLLINTPSDGVLKLMESEGR